MSLHTEASFGREGHWPLRSAHGCAPGQRRCRRGLRLRDGLRHEGGRQPVGGRQDDEELLACGAPLDLQLPHVGHLLDLLEHGVAVVVGEGDDGVGGGVEQGGAGGLRADHVHRQ